MGQGGAAPDSKGLDRQLSAGSDPTVETKAGGYLTHPDGYGGGGGVLNSVFPFFKILLFSSKMYCICTMLERFSNGSFQFLPF